MEFLHQRLPFFLSYFQIYIYFIVTLCSSLLIHAQYYTQYRSEVRPFEFFFFFFLILKKTFTFRTCLFSSVMGKIFMYYLTTTKVVFCDSVGSNFGLISSKLILATQLNFLPQTKLCLHSIKQNAQFLQKNLLWNENVTKTCLFSRRLKIACICCCISFSLLQI